jgi:L-lactate dehydrogenase complex protein LldE
MSADSIPPVRTIAEEVGVFTTCLVDQLRPDIADAVLGLLRHHGYRPVCVRGGTCCGQPAWNTGLISAARRVARRTLRAVTDTTGPVVVPSGSCATMMHEFWPELFRNTRDEAAAIAAAQRVTELSAFLAPHAVACVGNGQARVVYHDSCHMLRELGIYDAPRRLLAADGIEVVDISGADLCCGFGGTFSVKLPEISTRCVGRRTGQAGRILDLVGTVELTARLCLHADRCQRSPARGASRSRRTGVGRRVAAYAHTAGENAPTHRTREERPR